MGYVELRCSMLKYIGELGYQSLKKKVKIFHIEYRLSTWTKSTTNARRKYLARFREKELGS